MFVAAEILILIVALVVAIVRLSTGPVLLPVRVVTTVFVDVARGVPLILVIFAIGFGVPALELQGVSIAVGGGLRRCRAGVLVFGLRVRGVPGRHQLGAPQPGRRGPLAGLPQWASMRM